MPTKLIVFGAEGLLGNALISRAEAADDMGALGLDREACDVTDLDRIKEVCGIWKPQVLVNCAAYTDVDGAERDEERATEVNGVGAGNVAQAARAFGVPMIHISTDYVFDGTAKKPYKETSKPNPISAYGRSKLRGEQEVKEHAPKSLIVRTGWLYGAGGNSFIAKILEQARQGNELRVVDDQFGSPTSAFDLAETLLELVRQKRTGVVHAVNSGETTWYRFAQQIVELAGLGVDIQPIPSSALERAAPRPPYAVLDTSKLSGWLEEPMPTWEDALERFLHDVGE